MSSAPAQLMETYLSEVVVNGRLELIEDLALPDMVDEANQAFGGPAGRAGLVAHTWVYAPVDIEVVRTSSVENP